MNRMCITMFSVYLPLTLLAQYGDLKVSVGFNGGSILEDKCDGNIFVLTNSKIESI